LLALLAVGACGGDDDDEDASADGSAETTSPEAEDETVFALEVGDCVAADPTGEQVSEVPTVDCAEPHVSEVFHTPAIDAEELPSAAEIGGIVQEECFAEFESFVAWPTSPRRSRSCLSSPATSRGSRATRELVCMITDPAGQSTGTLEGVNR
jgi:hypothetical protein